MKNNYDFCIKEVLKSEGGYTNDPNDKGGPTNFGITIADVKLYVKKDATASDVKALTLEQAKEIYRTKYWAKVNGDALPSGVDYTVFDYGVNSGVSRANKVLAQFKDNTPAEQINKINDERLHFMHNIRNGSDWIHFGKGWGQRVERVRKDSIALSTSKTPSVATGAVVTAAAAGGSFYQWGIHHWMEIAASVAVIGVLAGIIVHYLNKSKQGNK